jgi:hypothetical protein
MGSKQNSKIYIYEECHLLGYVAMWLLLRTDVSEEHTASIIRVKRISEPGMLAVTSNSNRCSNITANISVIHTENNDILVV